MDAFKKVWDDIGSMNYERANKELIMSFILLLSSSVFSMFQHFSNHYFNNLAWFLPKWLVDKSIVFDLIKGSTYLLLSIWLIYKVFEQITKFRVERDIQKKKIPKDIPNLVKQIQSDYTIPRVILVRIYFTVVMVYASIILAFNFNFLIILLKMAYKDLLFVICFVFLFGVESFPALKQFFFRSFGFEK